jgi:hypothetical protein
MPTSPPMFPYWVMSRYRPRRITARGSSAAKCGSWRAVTATVGIAVLEERRDHLLVYSIAVRPTEQGRGHGSALLDFADQSAIALGLAVIRLYTNVRMKKNIALYRRHGYVEAGTRPHSQPDGRSACRYDAPPAELHFERLLTGAADVKTIKRTSALRRCGSGWSRCWRHVDVRGMHQAGRLVKDIFNVLEFELR